MVNPAEDCSSSPARAPPGSLDPRARDARLTSAGQFIQNWQTPKKAGACYTVTTTTMDGSKLSAWFILK
jgi:hypothetical protein